MQRGCRDGPRGIRRDRVTWCPVPARPGAGQAHGDQPSGWAEFSQRAGWSFCPLVCLVFTPNPESGGEREASLRQAGNFRKEMSSPMPKAREGRPGPLRRGGRLSYRRLSKPGPWIRSPGRDKDLHHCCPELMASYWVTGSPDVGQGLGFTNLPHMDQR